MATYSKNKYGVLVDESGNIVTDRAILQAHLKNAPDSGSEPVTPPAPGITRKANPVIDALTERLLQQGKGISSSSSSNLQKSIEDAIASTQRSGKLSSQALQSEREREVGFAQDRASATFTTALESRSGYATQVTALKELTETTEKSVRDLDKRYQEAILSNDAATAQRVADLQMQKLTFLQQQEQNFFNNAISLAGLRQQEDMFYAGQEEQQRQFMAQMAQSDYQFEKNLGIQYKELSLKTQELELARERNQISWAEFNLQKKKLDKEMNDTSLKANIYTRLKNDIRTQGTNLNEIDPLTFATDMVASYAQMGIELDFDDVLTDFTQAKTELAAAGIAPRIVASPVASGTGARTGGIFSGVSAGFNSAFSPMLEGLASFYLGTRSY